MSNVTVTHLQTRVVNKHDIEANWNKATNFIPLAGEIIIFDPEVKADGSITQLPTGRSTPYTYARYKTGDGTHKLAEISFDVTPEFVKQSNLSLERGTDSGGNDQVTIDEPHVVIDTEYGLDVKANDDAGLTINSKPVATVDDLEDIKPFVAIPYQTTFDEIIQAATAGRIVYTEIEGIRCNLTQYSEDQILFMGGAGVVTVALALDSSNEWQMEQVIGVLQDEFDEHANDTSIHFTPEEKSKLAGIAAGAEANVQSDWNATSGDAFIKNKPSLAAVATSGNYNDLTNKPVTIEDRDAGYHAVIDAEHAVLKYGTDEKYLATLDDIPTVNNGTLTIKRNGEIIGSFSANQSTGKEIDINVPTHTSDLMADTLTSDSGGEIEFTDYAEGYSLIDIKANDVRANGKEIATTDQLPTDAEKATWNEHLLDNTRHVTTDEKTILSKITFDINDGGDHATIAADDLYILGGKRVLTDSDIGTSGGAASLDSSGKVPSSQLPSYVDDVVEYTNKSSFPATGEAGKIYIDVATNKSWRWSGSTYVEISSSLALGETSSTAYRGDRGKIAYDHSQSAHAPTNAEKNQNAFSNVTVGSTTIAADTTTDTLTIAAGANVSISADATNDKITISSNYSNTEYTVEKTSTPLQFTVSGSDDVDNVQTVTLTPPTIDSALSSSSTNAVQNKVVKAALDAKSNTSHTHEGLYHPTSSVFVDSIASGSSNGTIAVTYSNDNTSEDIAIKGLAGAAYKTVDTSISASSTSTNLPTSKAVAAFVEGKGYKTTDNNTTYTIASGDSNGQIKVTPSVGSAYNVNVKGLGSAAYTNSDDYIDLDDFTASTSTALTFTIQSPTDAETDKTITLKAPSKSDIGLGNLDNVKQYSASNPPPYPVTSVAGKTGAVTLEKGDVGLGSVVNTGDSATPVSGGTTKFTTGGAYTELNKKVDKVTGKGLSTNDYTTAEKNKLAGIAANANNYTHPSTHPASMITGLAAVATSGNYTDLTNKPVTLEGRDAGDHAVIDAEHAVLKYGTDEKYLATLDDIPAVGNGTLTIKRNGTAIGTFKANQSTNQEINISVPTASNNLSDFNNDTGFVSYDDITAGSTPFTLEIQDPHDAESSNIINLAPFNCSYNSSTNTVTFS